MTTVEELGPAAGNRLIWDNSNIIESYSGVTSPMTFSFIRRAYSIVYHCFAEVMGIDARTVKANREVFDNMLGLFRGQVYYNLLNWYRLVRLFPGFNYNKSFMESMMGVREPARADAGPPGLPGSILHRRCALRVGGALAELLHIPGSCGFPAHFRAIRALVGEDFSHSAHSGALPGYEEKLLWSGRADHHDFRMISTPLKKLCVPGRGRFGSLQNVHCGEGGSRAPSPRNSPRPRRPCRKTGLRRCPSGRRGSRLEVPADPRSEFAAASAVISTSPAFACQRAETGEHSLKAAALPLYDPRPIWPRRPAGMTRRRGAAVVAHPPRAERSLFKRSERAPARTSAGAATPAVG